MLPTVTGEFTVVRDPELRFAPSGTAVATMRVVANGRKFDKDKNEWVDDKVCWLKVIAFKKLAENIAETLTQGARCIVIGKMETEEYEVREGENAGQKRQSYTIIADFVGPSIAFKGARILESEGQGTGTVQRSSEPTEDPWQTPPATDEPPF